jgi:hypothetical protein
VLTRTLDADGSFPDERALARDIEALAANPDRSWTLAPVFELHAPAGSCPIRTKLHLVVSLPDS